LDRQGIHKKIEILRNELTMEYEKCFDKGTINSKVINLSQKLDELILDFMKLSAPKSN